MDVFVECRTDIAGGVTIDAIGFLQYLHYIMTFAGIGLYLVVTQTVALADAFIQ